MKPREEYKMIALDVPAADFDALKERAKTCHRTFAGEIRHTLHQSFFPPADPVRQAYPSRLDAKLRGKVFALALRGVELSTDRRTGERLATVSAEALEEAFGVFCAITGQDPSTLYKKEG